MVKRLALLALAIFAIVVGAFGLNDDTSAPDNAIVPCDPSALLDEVLPNGPTEALPDLEGACPQPTNPPVANQSAVIPPAAFKAPSSAPAFRSAQSVYANGRLPASVLCAIYGGRLRCDAARAWNAMNTASRRLYGVTLSPAGSLSSYRDLAGQYSVRRSACAAGRCYMAAVPGTSNHGLGIAVDIASRQMAAVVAKIGARFGWLKRCSDAAWEWWHHKYNPACTGSTFKAGVRPSCKRGYTRVRGHCRPVLRHNGTAKHHPRAVRLLQRHLKDHCLKVGHRSRFDARTRRAVRRLQRGEHLRADGVVGKRTWRRVLSHGRC